MKLRLTCGCGRNLADVTDGARKRELRGVLVTPRPNVDHRQTSPGIEVPGEAPTTARPPTHTLRCRCGRTYQRRHERIVNAWTRYSAQAGRVVRITLDGDV